jgi:glycosyltransferase involved in cell wall biosynthesis
MNVGLDAKRLFFNHTGLGNYSRQVLQALHAILPADARLYLYSPKPPTPISSGSYTADSPQAVQIVVPDAWYKKMWGGAVWRSWWINNDLKKQNIAVYYALSNEIPYNVHLIKKMRVVVVIHDLIFWRYSNMYPAIDVFIYKQKTRYACTHAHHILAPSMQTKRDIIDILGIDADKISILPPICDAIYGSAAPAVRPPNGGIDTKYLLSVGAITPRKNLLHVVQAWLSIQQKMDIDLVVVGTAVGLGKKYLADVQACIDAAKPRCKVHFLGKVTTVDMPYIYQNAEMLVYPSLFEGFGMPIVEALSCGVPVVTSEGGCFGEAGGGGAVYVNPDDIAALTQAIKNILNDPNHRQQLITQGQKYIEKFSPKKIGNELSKIHQKITNLP